MALRSQFDPVSLWSKFGVPALCILLTTALYALAFAPFHHYQSAFICFTPFITWSFFRPGFRRYAISALIASILCWATTLHWLYNLGGHLDSTFMTWGSVLGCALIFAPFHWFWYLLLYRLQPCLVDRRMLIRINASLAIAGGWVILEWARESFLHVQWNTLSSVLWQQPALLQAAAYTGSWGLSFYIILFNLGITLYVRHLFTRTHQKRSIRQKFCPEFYLVFGILGLLFLTFFHSLDQAGSKPLQHLLRAVAIQPNISQKAKSDPKHTNYIRRQFEKGMSAVMKEAPHAAPDVFLWPESATPLEAVGNTKYAQYTGKIIQEVVDEFNTPLLMGNMKAVQTQVTLTPDPNNPGQLSTQPLVNLPGVFQYWNAPPKVYQETISKHGQITVKPSVRSDGSLKVRIQQNGHFQEGDRVNLAYNLVSNGIFLQMPEVGVSEYQYLKQRLVPFGEYMPLGRLFPFIKKIVQVSEEFQPGQKTVTIPVETARGPVHVGPLVCYEDVFSSLSREHVKAGADFLFVATNDGWYGKTGAHYQHTAHSVLRAIETRRPVMRCGNNGWTGWIDELGRVQQELKDPEEGIYKAGQLLMDVKIRPAFFKKESFYVKHGDWFVLLCAVFLLAAFLLLRKKTNLYGA